MENNNQVNEELNNENLKKDIKVETNIMAEKEQTKGFFSRLMSGVVDQCIVVGSSLIAMLILDGIFRLLGYYITERIPVFFILYVLANIIYPTIMQGTKFKTTFGNKLFK